MKLVIAICVMGAAVASANPAPGGARVQFNRDVRPILTANCFQCHGPDPAARKAGLRLDREEGLFGKTDNGIAVQKGKPGDSDLYQRIISGDADEVMPPPKTKKVLTAAQKDVIGRWIGQGAKWEPHWSFVAPERPEVPEVKDGGWVRNPIDGFVLAKLEANGLTPAPDADRRALARRVSLDVTGLPPEPAEVDSFVSDRSADAYEKYVDLLLASPHYGEHRARYWLDAARYADTNGLHFDNYREMWPYRQWVIAAFNRNEPFDQFTVEQLAGDLLPNATRDQQIATGFHRCNVTSNEGGSITAELEANYAKDRVETTSSVWLGLTAQCCSCHDHKFDPITQKDFYSMSAYFRNTAQPAFDGNVSDTPPVLVITPAEKTQRWLELERRGKTLNAQLKARRAETDAAVAGWLESGAGAKLAEAVDPSAREFLLAVDKAGDAALPKDVTWGAGPRKDAPAWRFATSGSVPVAGTESFDSDGGFTVAAWVWAPKSNSVVVSKLDAVGKDKNHGWKVEVSAKGDLTVTLVGDSPADRVFAKPRVARVPVEKWAHVCVTYDGGRLNSGISFYINGVPAAPDPATPGSQMKGSMRGPAPVRWGGDGVVSFTGGGVREAQLFSRALSAEEAAVISKWDTTLKVQLAKDAAKLSAADRTELASLYAVRVDAPYLALVAGREAVEREARQIRFISPVTHVMHEREDAQPVARVLYRGQYDQPREEVKPAIFTALHPVAKEAPANRMGLARWIVDARNPLTARVTINRYWQEIFGAGIVRTTEDFGIMGEPPVNQALLDWLAVEFQESGWDVKHMIRLMVTSAAYRQSAVLTPEKLSKDPANRLLSRGPRFRMDAEMVRDAALAESSLLVRRVGGPSVRPYQPDGVWEAVAMPGSNTRNYKRDAGEGLYRRSLYTFWKRAAPPPSMDVFNAPTRESCTVRRERTDTPLQALVTMNDTQFVEASRVLAERAIKGDEAFNARANIIAMRVLSRRLHPDEMKVMRSALDDLLAHYQDHSDEAKQLIAVGEAKRDEAIDPATHAAWTVLVNQFLNLDEALNK